MPELSESGELSVGVKTIEVAYPEAAMTMSGEMVKRELTLEVWYPASQSTDLAESKLAVYSDETRSGKSFEVQADAYRDAPIMATDENYPIVVISHGYTGYRTLMHYLGEHLASHGYVVAAIDHTDSTNKDVNFAESPYMGFQARC